MKSFREFHLIYDIRIFQIGIRIYYDTDFEISIFIDWVLNLMGYRMNDLQILVILFKSDYTSILIYIHAYLSMSILVFKLFII